MKKPMTKVAIAGGLLVLAAAIFVAQKGRAEDGKPSAEVSAGAFPTHRSPDEAEGSTDVGLPEGMAR